MSVRVINQNQKYNSPQDEHNRANVRVETTRTAPERKDRSTSLWQWWGEWGDEEDEVINRFDF